MDEALQQAIEIEIATIPVYLSTYYSVIRVPDQSDIISDLTNRLVKAGMSPKQAASRALDLSADIMVFANKAGALIISVVIEEMLHMSLSSNVKQAIAGSPVLVGKSPDVWPAELPGHEPPFLINRGALSLDQLYTFLQIEAPKPLHGKDLKAKAIKYTSIGRYYKMIEDCIAQYYTKDSQYNHKPQLVPGRGYYAQNNINTNYYNKEHKPNFVNAHDSGDLIHVTNMKSALHALREIVEQGEGSGAGDTLPPNDPTLMAKACKSRPKDVFDDKDDGEKPHYEKFFDLYCQLMGTEAAFRNILKDPDFDVKQYFVHNFEVNPVSTDYPTSIRQVSILINAIYTYLFVMTEACYHKDENTQFEIFMFGIHKTMMWILGSLCEEITAMSYIGSDGKQYNASATFENYDFAPTPSPKEQIISLYNQAVAGTSQISNVGSRIHDLPNVYLEPYLKKTGQPLMSQ